MNSDAFLLSRKVKDTIKIMDDKKLPYTYFEIVELVDNFNGDLKQINNFIDGYEKHLSQSKLNNEERVINVNNI